MSESVNPFDSQASKSKASSDKVSKDKPVSPFDEGKASSEPKKSGKSNKLSLDHKSRRQPPYV